MAATLTQVATAAAQFLGVLYSGESLSAQQLADALAAINNMLDNWSSQKLLVMRSLLQSQPYTAATQSYALTALKVEAAHNIVAAGPSNPIEVLNAEQWSRLPDRQAQSYMVRYCFYDRAASSPLIYFSPIPVATSGSAQLTLWVALTQFADLTTPVTFLPGYERLIKLGAAIELAPQYLLTPSPTLLENFKQATENVVTLNQSLFGPDSGDIGPPAKAA